MSPQNSLVIEGFLSRLEPFRHLSSADRKGLVERVREKRYAKGELLFREGQSSDAVWVVKTGRVHLSKILSGGKVSTTCVMTPGETFCCLPALDRKPYPVDAVAAENSIVLRVPLDVLHQVMGRSPDFAQRTTCLFCNRLRQVERAGCGQLYQTAEARPAQTLLALSKKFGNTIPLTRQELAEITGTTHETVIRTLSRFKQQGMIKSSRGKTTILQPDRLSDLLKIR